MSLVGDKSKAFAVRIVRLYQYLQQEKKSLCCQSSFSVPEPLLEQI